MFPKVQNQSIESWVTLAVICVAITHFCTAAANSSLRGYHKIMGLPGQPNVSFQQYAGHITISREPQRALFYYFVEAETDATSKPLVLWLSGGPGCSSVGAGAFIEHGPFKTSRGGTLVKNNYSWNKVANMLYLESPAGVGFSYSKDASFYQSVNDTFTAQDNLIFLQNWLENYPDYKTRDFYITGDSYAGHYVPQLAKLIVQEGSKFNLKGIAVGNPLLEFETDENSRALFYWSHGIISDEAYELSSATCNISQLYREKLTSTNFSGPCRHLFNIIANQTERIDGYDVTADVCETSGGSQAEIFRNKLMKPRFQLFHSLQSVYEPLTTQSVSTAYVFL
uniref:Uncharacterized protein MANES_08G061300 n=1 Tax=Rhizophora mucronata TaxID=61149 RepID=A0A2P2MCW3_RHIMU